MQKNEVGLSPNTKHKINSKWIKDLNIRKRIKLLEENIGLKLHRIGFVSVFLDMTTKAQVTEEKIDQLDFVLMHKEKFRGTWVVQRFECLPLAQVLILGSQD